jgi:hypothetical protein
MTRARFRIVVVSLLATLANGPLQAAEPVKPAIPAQESAVPKAKAAAPAKKPVTVEIKPACYTQAQYRAEQAVRYQTQLMVAGMLCQSANPRSYSNYQAFTQRNTGTINRAENVLMAFFKEHRTPQAELSLHTLRTNMANDISIKAMQLSLPVYCKQALPRLTEASALQPRQFETYLTKLDLKQTSTRPVCADAQPKVTLISLKESVEKAAKPMAKP